MDREGFRNRMKQYKEARGLNPLLKYWEWKAIPKYGDGTGNVEEWDPRITAEGYDDKGYYAQAMNPLPEVTVVGSKTRSRSERPIQFTYVNGYPEATAVTTDYNVAAGALERVYPEFDLLLGARAIKMLPTKAEKLGRFLANERIGQPVTSPLSPATSTYVPNKNHAKTSLKFFERPSKLTQEEQNGFLKHYRNRSRHSKQYGTDFGKYDIRAQKSDSPIFSEFVGDGSESAVFSSKNNKWVYKIYDGASFNDLDELRKWTNNFLLRNKIDFAEPITYKGFVTSKLGIHPVFRQKKLTPISWNDPKMADILTKIKEMYKNAGWDDRMVKDGLQLNDMQIQNFAYDKLGNLKAIDVDVYPINGFADGGEVQPDTIDPVDMYNKTRYQVNGIPINDKPLDNVLSPWDIPLGTAYKVWPAVNSFLKNYGPTLGAMVVGSTGKTSNKKSSPITTKQIDPTLKEYHEDIVIPLRPQDKYTKQVYLNNPDNFTYNMYADDVLPDNRLADYNPRTGEIRIKESVANSELSPQVQGHESGHRIDQIMPRTDEAKQKIDEALQVGPRPLSKESRLLVEKEGEIDRLGYNLFKYMKDNNLMLIKEPTAKTKAFQEFITNATDELLAQMLGDMTVYTKDYKQRGIDYGLIRWILQNQPMILPGLVIQQDLLTDKTEKQWT